MVAVADIQMPSDVAERLYREAVNYADARGITLYDAIETLDLSLVDWCDLKLYIEAEYGLQIKPRGKQARP